MSDGTLSGLELRKAACEALGWRQGSGNWHRPGCICETAAVSQADCFCKPKEGCPRELPAIESDPAVSEPMFLEWTWKNDLLWEAGTAVHYDDVKWPLFEVTLCADRGEGRLPEPLFTVTGVTLSEARARAIVATSEAMKEKR